MKFLLTSLMLFFCLFSYTQEYSSFIIVDQFGYLPNSQKIAILKDPQVGFDSEEVYTPGNSIALVNANTLEQVYSAESSTWKNGATDASSGDKVWHFDFSSYTQNGRYYILDIDNNLRSYEFEISPAVYNEVLKHAVRTFFYQRVGHEKAEQFAGVEWADGASHMGTLQDKNCRRFDAKNDASTERDVSGGWYDAGDLNKYTSWTASYVIEMMLAYLEVPTAWADDYNIPESGNGIPDLLDEAKWGVDHLLRLQEQDGSVISIVGESHASPPSAATGQSLYGTPNTSATLNTAAALAISSKVYRLIGLESYADSLQNAAVLAWEWANANPNVLFNNNDDNYGSSGLGAGSMETDDYGRLTAKLRAAAYLFDITSNEEYKDFFESNYLNVNLFQWNFAFPFQSGNQDMLLYYSNIENASTTVVNKIKSTYKNAMNGGSENFPAQTSFKDPYLAHIKDYGWGCNRTKSVKGSMFLNLAFYDVDKDKSEEAYEAAEGYIHYIHGVNPLNMVYLSNMYKYGAENGVNEFYHTWFSNGSAKWDRVGESTYGPAPGFLTGGANPGYDWDGCCPSGCGSANNNSVCTAESISPPKGQPDQKSYKDFNTSWPLNSWSVTENSCGYQIAYIRLLSKFVNINKDCNGDEDGSASIDVCGNCTGGNTGIEPITNAENCNSIPDSNPQLKELLGLSLFPNPVNNELIIKVEYENCDLKLYDSKGALLLETCVDKKSIIDVSYFKPGIFTVKVSSELGDYTQSFIKK
ncbi:MAG: glycoside hydrolase family 9 protein [Prolixibacteraceae bacterium]|jgi:endoglucanase|nr:glycoside hydrolase family 9 protein [Prolixibacteraceae bacterium]